jgi:hypothetical protein
LEKGCFSCPVCAQSKNIAGKNCSKQDSNSDPDSDSESHSDLEEITTIDVSRYVKKTCTNNTNVVQNNNTGSGHQFNNNGNGPQNNNYGSGTQNNNNGNGPQFNNNRRGLQFNNDMDVPQNNNTGFGYQFNYNNNNNFSKPQNNNTGTGYQFNNDFDIYHSLSTSKTSGRTVYLYDCKEIYCDAEVKINANGNIVGNPKKITIAYKRGKMLFVTSVTENVEAQVDKKTGKVYLSANPSFVKEGYAKHLKDKEIESLRDNIFNIGATIFESFYINANGDLEINPGYIDRKNSSANCSEYGSFKISQECSFEKFKIKASGNSKIAFIGPDFKLLEISATCNSNIFFSRTSIKTLEIACAGFSKIYIDGVKKSCTIRAKEVSSSKIILKSDETLCKKTIEDGATVSVEVKKQ